MSRKTPIVFWSFVLIFVVALWGQPPTDQENEQLTFLQQMFFENQNHCYDDFLQEQFELLLQKAPFYKQNDQLLWMYGKLLEGNQQIARAFLQYLKLAVLYPHSSLSKEATARLQHLLDEQTLLCFADCREPLMRYLQSTHYFENPMEGLFNIFTQIFALNAPCFDEPLLAELKRLEQSCTDFTYEQDLLLYWKGLLLKRLGQYSTAYGQFRKLQQLFPQSSLRPAALFESAYLAYRHLRHFEQARDGFIELISHFPEDAHSPPAQFYLAELYADSLDSLQAGMDNYRLFLEAYSDHPLAKEAFKRLTFLYLKTHRYEEAITLIGVNLNRHGGDSTITALVDSMANVFEKEFKKYETAARCFVLLASQTPMTEKTPYYLYRAARIYYLKMKDRARAKDICLRLQKNFAESAYSEKCKLLLKQAIQK